MYWGVVVFEAVCWVSFTLLIGAYLWASVKQRRMHPGLWLSLGIFSMSWLESPYDNTMYAVFHPDFHRLPAWGPIGVTQGGLPIIAPPGYVMYFLLPAAIAVPIARWAIHHYRWPEPYALLGVGLAVGMMFDGFVEIGQANTLHLWTFARTAPGLTVFPGTLGQVPATCWLAMGIFMMIATYLLGRRIDSEPVLDRWVAARTRPGGWRTSATALAYIVVAHVVYLLTMAPHAFTKLAGLLTQAGVVQPYPDIAAQPAGLQTNGALGTVVLVVWLVAVAVGMFVLVGRYDPAVRSQTTSSAPFAAAPGASGDLIAHRR